MAGRIRIGNQTAASAATLAGPFEFALKNGFDAFEWFPDNWNPEGVDAASRRRIREAARAAGLALSVHAPWWANPLEPCSEGQFMRSMEFARDIGAGLLVVHLYAQEGVGAYARAMAPVVRAAGGAGLRLAIENTPLTPPGDFNRLFEELAGRGVHAGGVGMCLDLGHANLCAETANDYLGYMDKLSPAVPIIHVHLHENFGDRDSHLALFTGPSANDPSGIEGFLARLVARGFSGAIILEQWPEDPRALVSARDRLLDMLGGQRPLFTPPPASETSAGGAADTPKETEKGAEASSVAVSVPPAATGADFASALAHEDRLRPSWRLKLEAVDEFLSGRPSLEELVHISIYLKFVATGAVPCAEDGRHFRPSRHARTARRMERKLATVQRGLTGRAALDAALVLRRIYPYLPSHEGEFLRAEPLTLIRDIAHRGDIPRELKAEIKHSLQNKLHRCAGPEDLMTSQGILRRITSPGAAYPPEFVRQFKVFHQQLLEFFNAEGLAGRLEKLARRGVPDRAAALIKKFLRAKKGGGARPETLGVLTALREALWAVLSDTGDEALAQQARLADIGLEDFAFALVSEFTNSLDFGAMEEPSWAAALGVLGLSARNMALSGSGPEECLAVEAELGAMGTPKAVDREGTLRALAALERARRLSESYTERLLALYPGRVERLGRLLGVEERAIRHFAEGEVRGSLAFQVSRLSSGLLSALRKGAGLSPWDALVTGRAQGRLLRASSLAQVEAGGLRAIALVDSATGYEDVPDGVAGVVLCHEIPHLSHLLVRARQEGVVFAATGDEEEVEKLRALVGEDVVLEAAPDGVRVARAKGEAAEPEARGRGPEVKAPVPIPEADLAFARRLIILEEAGAGNAGGKAEALRRLAGLAALEPERAGYETLPALAVPFGVMEEAVREAGAWDEYSRLLRELEGSLEPLGRLRELILGLPVHEEITRGAASGFKRGDRLAVRSSANLEDLPWLSGAGLYDTVVNVPPPGVARAVREVWASLFTRRAARARGRMGIPHGKAHMAVVIQKMASPDYSFVLFTADPVRGRKGEAYMELAPGLGETLVSGVEAGTPYRFSVDKATEAVETLAMGSMGRAALAGGGAGEVVRRTVDYSKERLTVDRDFRLALARRLGRVAAFLEGAMGGPQDAEGALVGGTIYLVQCRPMGP